MEKLEINILPKFIDEAATPVAKSVGNTVSGVWELVFGNQVSLWLKKQEYKHQQNYKDFVEKVNSKIESIPKEKLKEPDMHIIGPAIENSKHYIHSEILREMFANLIASSINIDLAPHAHPSFVEIIKQLSPDEAKILSYLKRENFGFIHVNAITSNSGKNTLLRNFSTIAYEAGCEYPVNTTVYLENLARLNLILLDNSRWIADPTEYEKIRNHKHAKIFIERANEIGTVDIQVGYAESTLFGIHFYYTCIE